MSQDIEIANLTVADAAELRSLFEGCAGESRQLGRAAQEAFLLGLAALVDGLTKDLAAATGEPLPAPVSPDPAGGVVDLADLSAQDAAFGAQFLLQAGQSFADKQREGLAVAFGQLARAFAESAALKGSQPGGTVN